MASTNEVFIAQAEKLISSTPDHPLKDLVNPDTGQFWVRSPYQEAYEQHPGVQAGHLTSKWAGGENLASQDAHSNQFEGRFVETRRSGTEHGSIVERQAIDIGGVPVEVDTARMWETEGLIAQGTVDNSLPSSGWRSGDHLGLPSANSPHLGQGHNAAPSDALAPGGLVGPDATTAVGATDAVVGALGGIGLTGVGIGAFGTLGLGIQYVLNELSKLSPPQTKGNTPQDHPGLPKGDHGGDQKPPPGDENQKPPPGDENQKPPPGDGDLKPPPPATGHGSDPGGIGGGMSKPGTGGTGGMSAPGNDGTGPGGMSVPGDEGSGGGGMSMPGTGGTGGMSAPGNDGTGSGGISSSSVALPDEDVQTSIDGSVDSGFSPDTSVDAGFSSDGGLPDGSGYEVSTFDGFTSNESASADLDSNPTSNDDFAASDIASSHDQDDVFDDMVDDT